MKRQENDGIYRRAKLSQKINKINSTSMNRLVSSKRHQLINQSNLRMAEDTNSMAALASTIIRSNGEYGIEHEEIIEKIKNACAKIELSEQNTESLISIINPFISTPQEESVPAKRLVARNDQYTLLKVPHYKGILSLKNLLEALRQFLAVGQSIKSLKPTFESVCILLLNLGQVVFYLGREIVHPIEKDESNVLKIIIEKTLCGRVTVSVEVVMEEVLKESIDSNSNVKEEVVKEKVKKILDTFENYYRIIDVSDGQIAFEESISFI